MQFFTHLRFVEDLIRGVRKGLYKMIKESYPVGLPSINFMEHIKNQRTIKSGLYQWPGKGGVNQE